MFLNCLVTFTFHVDDKYALCPAPCPSRTSERHPKPIDRCVNVSEIFRKLNRFVVLLGYFSGERSYDFYSTVKCNAFYDHCASMVFASSFCFSYNSLMARRGTKMSMPLITHYSLQSYTKCLSHQFLVICFASMDSSGNFSLLFVDSFL